MTSRSAASGLAPGPGQQSPVLVTGEQYELTAGDYRAVVTGLGAGLRELSYAGQPVVYGYPPDELPPVRPGSCWRRGRTGSTTAVTSSRAPLTSWT